jgi:serine/threonine protein kinase/tetratricopeptide (TPR) repeat protein
MIGKTISHYKIIEKLGEGGMGVVYKAEDTNLRRTVALKFLPPELARDSAAKARFIQEAQAASALDHPNICTIHEIAETGDGHLFISMTFYDGETLRDRISRGPIPPQEAVRIASQVAQGLAKAHESGIVHRDIKPANIIVTRDGTAKILDFGLAKLAGRTRLTTTPGAMGTVAYMSPEQALGKSTDHRSDIWSLGVVLYEMLAGRPPFDNVHDQAIIYGILHEDQVALTEVQPRLPMKLQIITQKALKKETSERYQSVKELFADLHSEQVKLTSPRRFRISRLKLSNRVLAAGALVGCLALLSGYYISTRHLPFMGTSAEISSLAVMSFRNLSAEPGHEYFSDGVTEALIGDLSEIKALRVTSYRSSMHFKNSTELLPDVARTLNVEAVVEGSVQLVGSIVRIRAQLVRAEPEEQIWSGVFTKDYRDILALQSEVAQAIAREVRIRVTSKEKERISDYRKVDPIAHDYYFKGRYLLNKLTADDTRMGILEFQKAIAIDSMYAPAYLGLAQAYDFLGAASILPDEAWPKVIVLSNKALALDESLAEAYSLLADAKIVFEWDWEGAELCYMRALDLSPNESIVRSYYASYLSMMGRSRAAIKEAKRGKRLDPVSGIASIILASAYYYDKQFDRAEREAQAFLSFDSTFTSSYVVMAAVSLCRGNYEEAISRYMKALALGDSSVTPALVRAYAASGKKQEAMRVLESVLVRSRKGYVSPTDMARAFYSVGERDSATVYMETAFKERNPGLLAVRVDPADAMLAADPQFKDIVKRMNLSK